MAVVAVGGDRGQRAALFAEIQPRIVHLRQHRLAARHAVQERCLHRCRPAGQPQQADAPHGLDQARIERCMRSALALGRAEDRVAANLDWHPPQAASDTSVPTKVGTYQGLATAGFGHIRANQGWHLP
ncbi:hypothetical protein G6F68_010147 [Rhizopus microsporus]|nr:hypothetical protein G6F68_010147 [Rhizopus microsporus]